MPAKRRRISLLLLLLIVVAFFVFAPGIVERKFNSVVQPPPYSVSEKARNLHSSLTIVDLHADSLLWGRNLLEHGHRGQVDIPRMQEGNEALQVFTFPAKTPWGLNIERNSGRTDQIFWLGITQRWPISTWFSLTERALYQAWRLDSFAAKSRGQFVVLHSASDLTNFLNQRQRDRKLTAGILGLEGAHVLEGKPENLQRVYDAGYRVIGLAHFFDNEFAGSAAGERKTGLTGAGRTLIQQMEERRMIVDLAHSSATTINDVLSIAKRPMLVSHTGVKGTCNNNRNLSDAQLINIAQHGGLIGIGFWDTASCGNDANAIARALKYTADLIGVQHVALGSDFDGAVTTPFDVTGMPKLTEALLDQGFSDDQIRLIMGENAGRFFQENLPE